MPQHQHQQHNAASFRSQDTPSSEEHTPSPPQQPPSSQPSYYQVSPGGGGGGIPYYQNGTTHSPSSGGGGGGGGRGRQGGSSTRSSPSSRKGTTRAKSTPPFTPPKSPRTRLVMEAAEGIEEEEGQGQGLEAEGIGSPPSRVTLAQVTGTPIGLLSRTGSSPASHSLPPSSPFANWEQSEAKRLSGTPLGELQEARVEIDGLHAHVRRLVIERDEHATAVLHAVRDRCGRSLI